MPCSEMVLGFVLASQTSLIRCLRLLKWERLFTPAPERFSLGLPRVLDGGSFSVNPWTYALGKRGGRRDFH